MKAKILTGSAPGGTRERLADKLPLSTPFVVQIFPIYSCNFKCCYCIFSIDKSKRGFISDKVIMDTGLLKRNIDSMKKFPEKIKVLRFVGIGEPLLHKDLHEMIRYSVEAGVANKVELLTNASLLTKEKSQLLIDAGLNRLVVSIQGTTNKKYKDTCGVDIDLEKFIENLGYFYEKKKNTEVYIKIVDTALEDKKDEERFFSLFGEVCDSIAVEHTVPIHSGVEYSEEVVNNQLTQFGLPVKKVKVCPQPFFTMQINPDGKVVPCYSFEYPGIMGDCNEKDAFEIWNSDEFNDFRRNMLKNSRASNQICKECSIIDYRIFPEDDLSDDADKILKLYE